MSDSKLSVSTSTLCMNNTLGYALTIEMSEEIDQVKVLEEERTILPNSLVFLCTANGASVGCRVNGLLGVLEGGSWLVVGDHDCGFLGSMWLETECSVAMNLFESYNQM